MNLVGVSLLTDCAGRRPDTAPSIKALRVLIRRADWASPADVERQFKAIARASGDGRVALDLDDGRLEVVIKVNYAIGLVRIVSVSTPSGAANANGS
jgi:mRNA-degrading endonuclease HigB of HigAB toxin-antitoxin module